MGLLSNGSKRYQNFSLIFLIQVDFHLSFNNNSTDKMSIFHKLIIYCMEHMFMSEDFI